MTENEFRKEFEDLIKTNSEVRKVMIGKFKEDYETSNCLQYGNYTGGDFGYRPCLKSEYLYFKKGDIIKTVGYTFRNGDANTIDIKFDNNSSIQVPMSKIDIIGSENVSKDEASKIKNIVKKSDKTILSNQSTPYTTQGSNAKEPLYYILVTAGVLVAGYFAYKKFKK